MITVERAEEIISSIENQKILVVGDLMLDRYVKGSCSRISPEAPVPVVHVTEEHGQPGGAANVALNIQMLGGHAVVAGAVGTDSRADELVGMLGKNGISTAGVVQCEALRTIVKTRVIADRQQIVRIDREDGPDDIAVYSADLCGRI